MVALDIRFQTLKRESVALIHWWWGELGDLGHAIEAFVAPERAQTLCVLVESHRIRVWVQAPAERSDVIVIEPDSAGAWPDDPLKDELPRIHGLRTVLMFSEQNALMHDVRLPAAAESSLPQVMRLGMERELPLPLHLLATDWWIHRRESSWLQVRVAAVRKAQLEVAQKRIEDWGLRVGRVSIAPNCEDVPSVRQCVGSLIRRQRPAPPPWTVGQRRLAQAAAVAVAFAVLVTGGQWIYERARLAAPLSAARTAQQQLFDLKRDFHDQSAPIRALVDKERSADAVAVLAQLSEFVGNETWSHDISLREDAKGGYAIELTGRSPNGHDLVEALRKQQALKDVNLLSSQMGEIGSGKNRISVAMHWSDPS